MLTKVQIDLGEKELTGDARQDMRHEQERSEIARWEP